MTRLFSNESVRALAVLVLLMGLKTALLGYGTHVPASSWPTGTVRAWGNNLVETMSSRALNKEAREALTAGYYEGLLNEGSRLSGMNRLVTDNAHRPSRFARSLIGERVGTSSSMSSCRTPISPTIRTDGHAIG